MKLSPESLLGLKRHFLGSLSGPSEVWLTPAPEPKLLLTCRGALRGEEQGCVLDFGTVESPGLEQRTLRVTNLGAETLTVSLAGEPQWVDSRWIQTERKAVHVTHGEGKDLRITVEHDIIDEVVKRGEVELLVEDLSRNRDQECFGVRLATKRSLPLGLYDFHGSPNPQPFDFGVLDPKALESSAPSYKLSIQNLTAVPLIIGISDLPVWLALEVDGLERRGPEAGRSFKVARLRERHGASEPPFVLRIWPIPGPEFLGTHEACLELTTNDARPLFQTVDLRFLARFETSEPVSAVIPSERVDLAPSTDPAKLGPSPYPPVIALAILFALLLVIALIAFYFDRPS